MKDMAADADRSFAEVGEDILDFDAIVAAGQEVVLNGTSWSRPSSLKMAADSGWRG